MMWLNDGGEVKVNKQVLGAFLLVNIVMRFYVMLCQCILVTCFLVDHDNMIRELYMIE
jgi:hypothetical protein